MINDGYSIVLFDLPVNTNRDRRNYYRFRKNLIKSGYVMLHKSIYYKYIRELKNFEQEKSRVQIISPSTGDIKILKLTNKQYNSIITIIGNKIPVDSDIDYIEY